MQQCNCHFRDGFIHCINFHNLHNILNISSELILELLIVELQGEQSWKKLIPLHFKWIKAGGIIGIQIYIWWRCRLDITNDEIRSWREDALFIELTSMHNQEFITLICSSVNFWLWRSLLTNDWSSCHLQISSFAISNL